jgi:hypothetical protein
VTDLFDLALGDVGEWDLSSGNLIKHDFDISPVLMAVSGDMIVICGYDLFIEVFNISTCLLVLP